MQKRIIRRDSQTGRFTRSEIKSVVKAVHVAPFSNGWKVRKAGRISASFVTKQDAIECAKTLSRNKRVDIVIHSKDGRIEKKIVTVQAPSPRKVEKHLNQ